MNEINQNCDVPQWAHQIANGEGLGPRTLTEVLLWVTMRLQDKIRARPTGELLQDVANSLLQMNDDDIWGGFEQEAIRNEAIARGDEDGLKRPRRSR